ncbi:LEA type 2 family protein [Haloarcula nitratireducens]|uniref:LEA type 2 family protein n=1 Tax=Haloarcula nitratireducens TaxID=2487749 RepID=A0AAW4PKQ9_9EURY|nr:LEA type 2 family protein [Halomicroarcula nitratireducens]MBX0298128.1 LEA type 2 family protein [Halomicroarcula nitratireducens]
MVDFRAVLFGTKLKAGLTILGFLVISVGGAFAVGILGTPSVVGVDNRFGTVTDETTTIETDLIVNNPNPIGVQLGGTTVNYTVSMNDISMASGSKDGLAVTRGNTSLDFTTQMQNTKIPAWWVSHIRNGERTQLEIDARVHSSLVGQSATIPHSQEINTDIISQFNSTETRPVNANQPVVSDPVLYINRTSASWGETAEAETPINMQFTMYNPKTTPYTVTEIGYDITMNDISVGEGTTDDPHVIPGQSQETITATTTIQNEKLDEWWVSHLKNEQITQLQIDFYARIELPTGNTIRVPLDGLTYTKEIKTDIFQSGGDEGSTANGNSTTTTAPGTATPTETDTTPSENETTTTDDGGLLNVRQT